MEEAHSSETLLSSWDFATYQNREECHLNSTGEQSVKTFYQPCLFISILQLNNEVKVERDVDVVGAEDCTDAKIDEVYRPSVLCIKTEYEVSIVI